MDILIGGLESNIAIQKLPGLILNGNNKFYVQAEDISGAKSNFIAIPGEENSWYVKKPKGDLLIVDDYIISDNTAAFYSSMFGDSLHLKYDIYDFHNQEPPYLNVTFLLTLKLFKFVFWYTDNNPSLDLLSSSTQKYIDAGGKIAFSMQFPQTVDLAALQSFLPIRSDSSDSRTSFLSGVKISAQNTQPDYPDLQITLAYSGLNLFI